MSTNFEGEDRLLSEWISQAEAARIQGISRQAIHKLVRGGRLRSKKIGGRLLISRSDLEAFRPQAAGRPRAGDSRDLGRLKQLLAASDPGTRLEVFHHLREEFPIHSIEAELGTPAEIILEAIRRQGPLAVRMIRGVIAEAAFERNVVEALNGWESLPFSGDPAYDFLLRDGEHSPIRVQVKLQRSGGGRPWLTQDVPRKYTFETGRYVVETQRTRKGVDRATGRSTRPYRFGEFDLLAVAMFPSTKDWSSFSYTVADWLLPNRGDPSQLETYQPVSLAPDDDWTDQFLTCASWFRAGVKKTIRGRA